MIQQSLKQLDRILKDYTQRKNLSCVRCKEPRELVTVQGILHFTKDYYKEKTEQDVPVG